jgi:hypothetical protein
MKNVIKNKWIIPLAASILTLSIAGAAFAATSSTDTTATTAGAVTPAGVTATAAAATATTAGDTATTAATTGTRPCKQGNGETALAGDTLAQVKAAALAAAGTGSTLMSATTETDNSDASIKYEAFVKKADDTCVEMYLDASFKVVSTETGGRGGMGHGFMGGNGGGANGETALSGDTLTKVTDAALAAAGTGSTLMRASTETDNSDASVKYEAAVKKADGTCLMVYLDASFKVVTTATGPQGGMNGEGMRGGHGRCGGADTTDTRGTSTNSTSTTGSI